MKTPSNVELTPVTGAWRESDASGDRKFCRIGSLPLESGSCIEDVTMAYETWGTYDGSNAVLILHALTGDSHVAGPAGPGHPTPGWWDGLVGPECAIDTNTYYVVAANILGGCQGTTGPASRRNDGAVWGSKFPTVTVRDQVRAEIKLADQLGINRWHTVMGGSAGGMRALEWAIMVPDRVERMFLLASSAAASAEQVALSATQNAVIRADGHFHGGEYYDCDRGPFQGLDAARRIAHISYRSEPELAERFGRHVQSDGRFAVDSYLTYHGAKLAHRFDANSFIVLNDAMNSHDIGRGRTDIASALSLITARCLITGIDSDRLYPLYQQQQIADGLGVDVDVIHSIHGHDGFLIETEQVGQLAQRLMNT